MEIKEQFMRTSDHFAIVAIYFNSNGPQIDIKSSGSTEEIARKRAYQNAIFGTALAYDLEKDEKLYHAHKAYRCTKKAIKALSEFDTDKRYDFFIRRNALTAIEVKDQSHDFKLTKMRKVLMNFEEYQKQYFEDKKSREFLTSFYEKEEKATEEHRNRFLKSFVN